MMDLLAKDAFEYVKPIYEDEDLRVVVDRLALIEADSLPVISRMGKLVGIITPKSALMGMMQDNNSLAKCIVTDIAKVSMETPIDTIDWAGFEILPVVDAQFGYHGVLNKKKFESTQHILNSRFDLLFNYNQSGILVINDKGIIVSYNPAAERISKLKSEHVVGKHLAEVNLPVGLLDVLKTGKSEISLRQKFKHITFITNRSPLIENGKIVGAIGIFQDISELEDINEKLRSSKEAYHQLQAILESSYDGFLITDKDGVVLQNNKAFERLTNLPSELILDKKTGDWVKKGVLKQDVVELVVQRRRSVTVIETTPGNSKLMITGNPVYNKQNEIIKVVVNVRDLSELTELKKELIETKELVERYVHSEHIRGNNNSELIFNSPKMKDLLDLAWRIAQVDSTVLIRGESGVGKELLAKFIFEKSKRRKEAFVKINCGAIPEHLLESELFGYESGAFTGAKKGGKMGLFELADKGTIFLDEIGELPIGLQVKLLRVLQEQEFVRVGGLEPKKVDVRILTATNRDLSELIKQGKFREDLYFRLNVIPIEIPPLRARKEDVIPLIYYFMKKFLEKYELSRNLDPNTINLLEEYDWPGNVRELSNVVERIIVTSSEDLIKPQHLPKHIIETSSNSKNVDNQIQNLKEAVAQFEKLMIENAVEKYGSTHKAAAALGINPSTLFRKIKS